MIVTEVWYDVNDANESSEMMQRSVMMMMMMVTMVLMMMRMVILAMVTVVLMMMMMVTVVTCDMMQEPVDQEIPTFPPPTHRLHDRQYIAKYAKYAVHNMQCKLDNIM